MPSFDSLAQRNRRACSGTPTQIIVLQYVIPKDSPTHSPRLDSWVRIRADELCVFAQMGRNAHIGDRIFHAREKVRANAIKLCHRISRTHSGGRPILALFPFTTIGRSIRMGWAIISRINCLGLFFLEATPNSR